MRKLLYIGIALLIGKIALAQETFPTNGAPHKPHTVFAFKNATLFVDYKTKLENAILIIQDGVVLQSGVGIEIPRHAVTIDLDGKFIYPSFIDPYSDYGMPEMKKEKQEDKGPQFISEKPGAYNWNQAIHPETYASESFKVDAKKAAELRKAGFGAVLTHKKDGIVRGASAAVSLREARENEVLLNPYAASHYSFSKGSSTQDYPSSLMGSIALLRQTFMDAQWYEKDPNKKEMNLSLSALNHQLSMPQVFEVRDYLNVFRADKIGDEFGLQFIFKGTGDEYKNIGEIKKTNAAFILPVNFPDAFDVEDPYDARLVSLEDLKHWELAPANAAMLDKNQIPFSFTADGLKEPGMFLANLRKAVKNGLSEEAALKASTFNAAFLLGMEGKLGTLQTGYIANFIITSSSLFEKEAVIYENWVQGNQYIVKPMNLIDIRGNYDVNVSGKLYEIEVSGEPEKLKGKVKMDTTKVSVSIKHEERLVSVSFFDKEKEGYVRLSGFVNYKSGIWDGNGQLPDGKWVKWSAIRKPNKKEEKKENKAEEDSLILGTVWFPNMAYGFTDTVKAETVLLKNATVWTNESQGIVKNADVLVVDGKIMQVGTALTAPEGAKVIDVNGKHITPGIIDEHSHIAISGGVNEGSQAITAEVSIADVVNSEDVNIYRQLSGGVTACQLLHGSANPIGGQSAIIKLRWGKTPEEMKIAGADGFIKFALGENVKQSNWGDRNSVRFPQTRMGVEQVYYDGFTRAREYEESWKGFFAATTAKKKKDKTILTPPRRDIEMEVLLEILNAKRFISCHSYVQSEINMLMHVADSMGFKVNTFTHILEGYKVADKMKAHGVGGSTFSDWWAYKFEVNDAIPYNGAIMHKQGVVTAFNSDDAEMARRLNQEAAKAVKYGGVTEEEALKFVTLNPAKLLHLDKQMGSIAPGKDADIVVWSDNPLSIYAKAEKTFVDGICYFDRERDAELRVKIEQERARLINKMIKAKSNGEPTEKPKRKEEKHYHCDTIEQY